MVSEAFDGTRCRRGRRRRRQPGADTTAMASGAEFTGPGPRVTGNNTGGIFPYSPGRRGHLSANRRRPLRALRPPGEGHQRASHLRRLRQLRLLRSPWHDPVIDRVTASRQAPSAPERAPPPPRCRRAECAGRAKAAPHSAASRSAARSSSANPPSGPTRTASGDCGCTRPSAAAGLMASASSSQNTRHRAGSRCGDVAVKRHRRRDLRQRKNAALLRRFDGIRAHALEIDPRHLAVAGEDGLQPRHAHLHGLLHHVIEPRRLQRSEQIVQVRRRGLLPRLGADGERRGALCPFERRAPLAVPAVENEDPVAGLQAQHMAEIVRLGAVERDRPARFAAARRRKAGDCGNRSRAWRDGFAYRIWVPSLAGKPHKG